MATAFAVFCATDGSLTFYNRDTVPSVGSTFEGKAVSNIYTGFETGIYSSTSIPWYNERASIISVSFTSEFSSIKPVNMDNWFSNFSNMSSFNGDNLDTSVVTSMNSLFSNCSNLTSLNLSGFDTSKVTAMANMFYKCSNLTFVDLNNFDTSKVTAIGNMFYRCSNLTTLDLSSFDTSSVTNMLQMFHTCNSLATIFVSDIWSTSSVTNSNSMFLNCTSLVGAVPYDSTKTDASMANYETGYFTYKRYVKPEDMLIKNTTLYNIADEIRILYGTEETMTPAVMNSNLNTFNTELSAINVEQDGLIEQLKNLFGAEFPEADTLDGCSWENISKVAEKGLASNFWSVGDRKAITLNGTVGSLTFSNETYYAYIIGFDHNSELEGGNTIHFQFGYDALSDGKHIAFVDSGYGSNKTSGTWFNMNNSVSNSGGWNSSLMRTVICPEFKSAMPSDLQTILKTVTKYSDNTGSGSDTTSYVTATSEEVFLLAEFEVFGARSYANSAEQNYQAQYDWYSAGNSKVRYRHRSSSVTAHWWLRSVRADYSGVFCRVYTSGSANNYDAYISYGFAPAFVV